MKPQRIILLVLDSLGIGSTPDARVCGDDGADTLGHIAEHFHQQGNTLKLPHLSSLGLLDAYHLNHGRYPKGMTLPSSPIASYACSAELSSGKDTPSGHWEMAGVPALWAWGYFPNLSLIHI